MGQRANLVLVDNTGYHLYYCHWCANTLPRDVFWGPQATIPFILQQRAVGKEDGWLDDIWSEGGVVVDVVRKVLLLYGGESIQYDIPLRRLYLELLEESWAGWDIRWAYEGIFDMADEVGVPRAKVLAERNYEPDRLQSFDSVENRTWVVTVGTVKFEDGTLRLYLPNGELENCLMTGEALVDMARQHPGLATAHLHEDMSLHPGGGFHLDLAKKQVAFWTSTDQFIVERIRPVWSGWDILWLKDNYEYQLNLAQGRLTFPKRPVDELLADLENILMAGGGSGLRSIVGMIKEYEDKGHDVQVNPYALRDDPQNIEFADRKVILDKAIAAWKQKKMLN